MTEQEVAQAEAFSLLAEAMPQIVWTALPDGRLDYVNQVLARYIGKSVAEALGLTDIEELKRALAESEERFRAAQEVSLHAFAILRAVRTGGRIADLPQPRGRGAGRGQG